MKLVTKFDKKKTYIYNSGKIATPEIIAEDYPVTQAFDCIVYSDASIDVFGGFDTIANARARYEIDNLLSNEEAIIEIERIINMPEPESEPSAEERIAAAMEFQNLMSI